MNNRIPTFDELPPIGAIVKITGDHPWAGETAEVVSHELVGLVSRRQRAKCRMIRDDAMDGHTFYVEHQWKLSK